MAAMMSAACVEDIAQIPDAGSTSAEKVQMTFSAVSDVDTKLTLADRTRILWEPGDGIIVNGDYFYSTLEEPSDYSEFVGETAPADEYYAVSTNFYPQWDGTGYKYDLQWYQEAVRNDLPYYLSAAKSDDSDLALHFRNLLGYIKFTIPEDGWIMKEVEVRAEGNEAVASGLAEIDFSGDIPRLVFPDDGFFMDYMTLNSESGMKPGDYYMAIYPGTFSEGLRFKFKSIDGKVAIKRINREISIDQGTVKNIGIIDDETDQLEVEREALIEFYNAMDGGNWNDNTNWCSDKPAGEWHGIVTDEDGTVVSINLRENNLSGLFHEAVPYLYDLSNLRDLTLATNNIVGYIPEDIDGLSSLVLFDIQVNDIKGSIPASFANIKGLQNLWLYANGLSGDVPKEIQEMELWKTCWTNIINQDYRAINQESFTVYFPDFDLIAMNGERITDEIYTRNEYTIYYHFGLYQPYTDYYTPYLVSLYEAYKDKGLGAFSFFNPYLGTKEEVQRYMERHRVSWNNVYLDDFESRDRYSNYIEFTPGIMVLDKNGKIVFDYLSNDPETLDEFLLEKFGPAETVLYESTDYSADGKVTVLQEATDGKGIDIVIMGDGYSDRLIEAGTFDSDMERIYESIFTIEPYASFRDKFNVYGVTTVSKNEVFDNEDAETALDCYLGYLTGGWATEVGGNLEKIFDYAGKAIPSERIDDATIMIMVNEYRNAGMAYMFDNAGDGTDWGRGAGVALFTKGAYDDMFETTMHHEALGHAFAKLADEYTDCTKTMTDELAQEISAMTEATGFYKNIDFTDDSSKVRWSYFLEDKRYAYDGLGVFEGGFGWYEFDVYRPTEDSIMRYNEGGFNAPSREAIYYRIHKLAYGPDWEYDYEKFVEYDAINRKSAPEDAGMQKRRMNYVEKSFEPTAPPVIIKGSWRDAVR